jgi:multisubunit Na+/H+ antiporter MnhE subunit
MSGIKRKTLPMYEIAQVLFVAFSIALTWLIFAGTFNYQEVVAAFIAGFAAAIGGYALRVQTGHRQTWLFRWLRYFPGIIAKGLADCWTLSVVLWRMISGRPSNSTFRRIPYKTGSDNPDDTGRQILTTIGTTLQPNSYVAGFNRERDEVLIHQLNPTDDIPIAKELRGTE